ncbi:hypothetical protein ACM66B_005707 [Microbotryomycetes sp. NB124-2]
MPSTAGFPTLGAMSTTTLGVTASVYSSFVTPAITVPFPSYYGTQTQVAFQWTNMPSLNGAQPTQIGGVEATNGVYSIMREYRATAVNPTPMKSSGDKGFEWPTWATAVIAGCGGAALIALVAGTCCWRRARKRKQQQRQQAQRVDNISKRASAYLSQEQQARDGFAGAGGVHGDKRRKDRKGAQPLSEKASSSDDSVAFGKSEGGVPVAATADALAATRSQKPHHKGNRLSKQYAHGHKPTNQHPNAKQMHDYDYPPYPMPPPAAAPSPTTNTPANSRDIDYRAGTTGYAPVAMNASTYSLNNDSNAAVHQQHYTPGYGQPGMMYPTDDHGNPIMPGLRGHRRIASDDSGYNTPTTMGAGNDSYSLQGSPARLLANAAPLSSRSRNASGNSEHWTSPGGGRPPAEHDAGMAIGGAMLGRGSGHDDDADLAPPVPVAMLPPGQRMGTPERKRANPRQRPDAYPQDDVRNRQTRQTHAPTQDPHRLGDGVRDSARLSRQPSPTYALIDGYTDDAGASSAPRARSAQSNYHDARLAPADGHEPRSQSAQSLRTGKRYGRRPADVQVPTQQQLYDSGHNVPLSPSMSSPAYASSSGDASSPGYASSDYRDAQQGPPGQAL